MSYLQNNKPVLDAELSLSTGKAIMVFPVYLMTIIPSISLLVDFLVLLEIVLSYRTLSVNIQYVHDVSILNLDCVKDVERGCNYS